MATKAAKIKIKQDIKDLLGQGKRRFEIVQIIANQHNIKSRQVDNYLAEIYKELESFYIQESESRLLDDLEWLYHNRDDEPDREIKLKFQKEINAVLGRNKKQVDVTTAGQPLTLEISINKIDET